MSADTNASTSLTLQAKEEKLKALLAKLVQEGKLESKYADAILQESIKRKFSDDVLSSTDGQVSYTGWLSVAGVAVGSYYFCTWSGDLSINGILGPAVGAAVFFYARMELVPKYIYNECQGYMTFRLAPLGMDLWFSLDAEGHETVGSGIALGPALAGGVGQGDFTIQT